MLELSLSVFECLFHSVLPQLESSNSATVTELHCPVQSSVKCLFYGEHKKLRVYRSTFTLMMSRPLNHNPNTRLGVRTSFCESGPGRYQSS